MHETFEVDLVKTPEGFLGLSDEWDRIAVCSDGPHARDLEVELVNTPEGFHTLGDEWDRVAVHTNTVFLQRTTG